MENFTETGRQQTMTSQAAFDGLKLALISLVTMSVSSLSIPNFLSIVVWLIQTVCSIWFLANLMKKYKENGNQSNFGYGFMVCLFSSIITAVYAFASYQWIFPGLQAQAMEAFDSMMPMMDSLQTDVMAKLQDNFAQYYCISVFFKNVMIGLIASSIISASQRDRNTVNNSEEL
ncbi:MAG: DUF4199 domain-containing protein [Bacteroidales bacterium]|nr:DUF4199 domain-containing protein [Bacteroidales bacterium]